MAINSIHVVCCTQSRPVAYLPVGLHRTPVLPRHRFTLLIQFIGQLEQHPLSKQALFPRPGRLCYRWTKMFVVTLKLQPANVHSQAGGARMHYEQPKGKGRIQTGISHGRRTLVIDSFEKTHWQQQFVPGLLIRLVWEEEIRSSITGSTRERWCKLWWWAGETLSIVHPGTITHQRGHWVKPNYQTKIYFNPITLCGN